MSCAPGRNDRARSYFDGEQTFSPNLGKLVMILLIILCSAKTRRDTALQFILRDR